MTLTNDDRELEIVRYEGLQVSVYRSAVDGRLIVAVETHDTDLSDQHADGIPDIRLMINDDDVTIAPTGELREHKPFDEIPNKGE